MFNTSQFHQPTCFWKWVGGTNPFKSGILSSEADPEKNIHCSWQDGHIIGTGNTWIFRKCLRKKFFVHNFCHNLGQTILLQFDHCPACLLHQMDFSFSMFLYFSRALFCICLALRWVSHHFPLIFTVYFILLNAFKGTNDLLYWNEEFLNKYWNVFRCDCVRDACMASHTSLTLREDKYFVTQWTITCPD